MQHLQLELEVDVDIIGVDWGSVGGGGARWWYPRGVPPPLGGMRHQKTHGKHKPLHMSFLMKGVGEAHVFFATLLLGVAKKAAVPTPLLGVVLSQHLAARPHRVEQLAAL